MCGYSAGEPECSNVVISEKNGVFMIKPNQCTELLGYFDEPQCVAVCPMDDTCIIDNAAPPRFAAIDVATIRRKT
jgi:ferredoxin